MKMKALNCNFILIYCNSYITYGCIYIWCICAPQCNAWFMAQMMNVCEGSWITMKCVCEIKKEWFICVCVKKREADLTKIIHVVVNNISNNPHFPWYLTFLKSSILDSNWMNLMSSALKIKSNLTLPLCFICRVDTKIKLHLFIYLLWTSHKHTTAANTCTGSHINQQLLGNWHIHNSGPYFFLLLLYILMSASLSSFMYLLVLIETNHFSL